MDKVEYVYFEPIKGDVYKIPLNEIPKIHYTDARDGSYLTDQGKFYIETNEWKIKYQNSLSLRVSQNQIKVYFVYPMKRGKVNTRAMVIDSQGVSYHTFVPTFPMPRLGESLIKLRMDLTVVSLEPVLDILEKVMQARKEDPSLV